MKRLFAPIICAVVFCKIIDTFSLINLNIPFAITVLICLILSFIFEKERSSLFALGPIGFSLALLVIVEYLVYLESAYRPNSFQSLRETALLFILFYFIKLNLADGARKRRFFLWMTGIALLFAVAGIIRCIRGLNGLQTLGFDELTSFKQYFTYGSWTTNALLLLPYPLSIMLAWKRPDRWSASSCRRPKKNHISIPAILLLLIILLFSFSRGAYVSLAVFVLFAVTGCVAFKLVPLRKLFLCGLVIAALLMALTFPVMKSLRTTAAMFETVSQNRSFFARIQLYKHTLLKAGSHPFLGVGAYNYPLYAMTANDPDDDSEFINTPLNRFISVLIEKGLVGLIAYAGALSVFFCVSFRKLAEISRRRALNKNNEPIAKPSGFDWNAGIRPHFSGTCRRDACAPGGFAIGSNENDIFSRVVLVSFIAAMLAATAHQLTYYASIGNEGTAVLEWVTYAVIETVKVNERHV